MAKQIDRFLPTHSRTLFATPHPTLRHAVKLWGSIASVALVALWVGSAGVIVGWRGRSDMEVMLAYGVLRVSFEDGGIYKRVPYGWQADLRHPGLDWRFRFERATTWWEFQLPMWAIAAPVLLATAQAWKWDAQARRRAGVGFCASCGYDLSATAATAPCPECGTARA